MTTAPLRHPVAPRADAALGRALRRSRRAWWTLALARALALAAAAAALVVPVAWLRVWWTGTGGTRVFDGGVAVAPAALAAFGVALVVALAVAAWRAPSLLDLARRADRVLGQQQRLSTSLEVQARGADNVIAAALVADAERRAAGLDWRPVGRTPWPRWTGGAIAVLVALAVVAAVVPVPARPEPAVAAGPTGPVDLDRAAADAEAVQRFAEVLAAVSAAEDSPYLQAVAASFADLAQRMTDGSIDAASASRALEELAGHLEAAARQVSPAFADAVRSALGTEAGAGAGPEAAGAAGDTGPGEAAQPSEAVRDAVAENADTSSPAADAASAAADASIYMALRDLAGEIERDPATLGLRAGRPAFVDPSLDETFYGGVGRAATDPGADPAEPSGMRADAPAGGDAVGAAQESTERAGDAAGGGSAALQGRDDAFLGVAPETTETTLLPWSERADGSYVEVELVPDAVLGEARAFERDVAAGAFRRADEAASTARTIGAAYRDVVGRYFMPGAVTAEGTP